MARGGEAPVEVDRAADADPRGAAPDVDLVPVRRARPEHDRPADEVGVVVLEVDAERLGELARAVAQLARRATGPRRARISSIPSIGSSARMSTAAPTPSGSQTALSSAWMP